MLGFIMPALSMGSASEWVVVRMLAVRRAHGKTVVYLSGTTGTNRTHL